MNTNNTKRCYQCMHFKQDSKYPTGDCDFTDFKEGFNLHAEDKACNRFEETDMRKVREAFENKFLEFECEKIIVAEKVAIEALKKRVPMQVTYEYDDEFTCPSCGKTTEDYDVTTIKFCPECGQSLTW